jgi:hypothetical protein
MREIIVGSHATGKKIWLGIALFAKNGDLDTWCLTGLILKRIGIAKFSSVYKSNNKFETCLMRICR